MQFGFNVKDHDPDKSDVFYSCNWKQKQIHTEIHQEFYEPW